MRGRVLVAALCSIAGVLPLQASMQTAPSNGIAGTYEGRYQCGEWHALTLEIRDLGRGRMSAVFSFDVPRGGQGSYAMTGEYDERSGRFQLTPQSWVRRPPGYSMVGLNGLFDRGVRTLRGKADAPCGQFELAPHGGVRAGAVPIIPRVLPLERQNRIFDLTNNMPESLEYWDSALDSPGKARESEPIDDVVDWLKAQDFWCLGTRHVSWNGEGTQGTATDHIDVRERYVIECDGDCHGLRYLPYISATAVHFAATQPVPVMEFKGVWFGGVNFQWKFMRQAGAGPTPDVYIHRWSSAKILSGQNCKAPKTKSR